MIPVPVPDELVPEGQLRRVLAAPDGDLTHPTIRPVEAVIDPRGATTSVRLALEAGELERLAVGGHVWLVVQGRLPVFALEVGP